MGIGTFLVIAVGANRLGPTLDPEERSSGTGGFTLFARSSLSVVHDLNDPLGRESLGLDAALMEEVAVVPMRVLPGDDASCLNLARPAGSGTVRCRQRRALPAPGLPVRRDPHSDG